MLNWLISKLRGDSMTVDDGTVIKIRTPARAHTKKAPVFEIKNPTQWKLERIRRNAKRAI